jgi:hypothetical protein
MDLTVIFLLLAVLVLVFLFMAYPFTNRWQLKNQSSHEISTLIAEHERVLAALEELDVDNDVGKIPTGEYSSQRASLVRKGSDILRRLDEIQGSQPYPAQKTVKVVEAELSDKLLSDEDLETLISKRRKMRQQKTAGFCPSCGKPILQSDQFCPSCGKMINSK